MINITKNIDDDEDFIEIIKKIFNNIALKNDSKECRIITINNWFGFKWLNFSGVVDLQLGIWKDRVTVPPFNPNRIIKETKFVKENNKYIEQNEFNKLHKNRLSRNNVKNLINQYSKNCTYFWYSSNTKKNDKGNIMIYIIKNNEIKTFYVEFIKKYDKWKPGKLKGISSGDFIKNYYNQVENCS